MSVCLCFTFVSVAAQSLYLSVFIHFCFLAFIPIQPLSPPQVAPAELEDLIRQLPDVADVGVVGVPVDRAAGEAPRAFVVVTPGSQLTLKAIQDFVADKVPPHKKLSGGLEYVDAIPRSPTGKILRRELKAMALSRMTQ